MLGWSAGHQRWCRQPECSLKHTRRWSKYDNYVKVILSFIVDNLVISTCYTQLATGCVISHIDLFGAQWISRPLALNVRLAGTRLVIYLPLHTWKYHLTLQISIDISADFMPNTYTHHYYNASLLLGQLRRCRTHIIRWGTGMIASSNIFCSHPGRVLRDLFRQFHAV